MNKKIDKKPQQNELAESIDKAAQSSTNLEIPSNKKSILTINKQYFIDKKLIIGLFMGVTIAAGTATFAGFNQDALNVNLDNNIGMSQVSKHLEASAAKCAAGEEGTLGGAIKSAMKMHEELASVAPQVEDLFGQQCMQNLSKLMDMSNFVGSIYASLLSTITDQFKNMIQSNVCKAIDKATGLIMNPVNNAINKVNAGLGGIEGKVNGFVINNFQTTVQDIKPELRLDTRPTDVLDNGLDATKAFKELRSVVNDGANNTAIMPEGMPDPRVVTQNIAQGMQQNNAALNMANQTYNNNQAQLIASLPKKIEDAEKSLNKCQGNNSDSNDCLNQHLALNNLLTTKERLMQENTNLSGIINAQPIQTKNSETNLNIGSLN